MSNPWSPERVISEEFAAMLILEQFPELSPISVEYLAEGWDNTALTINNEFVFRFPRRKPADELIETECRVLPYLANRISLPIPIPVFIGKPSQNYPWRFAGYKKLKGRTACSIRLTHEQRMEMALPLAIFLRELHDIPVADAVKYAIPPDTIGRLDMQKRLPQVKGRLENLEQMQIVNNIQEWDTIINNARDVAFAMSDWPLSLVHGDLYVRHLLVDRDNLLCGVIDWGDIHMGHPALDLSILFSFLPPQAEDVFIDIYGAIDTDIRKLAMFRALFYGLVLIEYGQDIKDDNLVREGKQTLEYLSMH